MCPGGGARIGAAGCDKLRCGRRRSVRAGMGLDLSRTSVRMARAMAERYGSLEVNLQGGVWEQGRVVDCAVAEARSVAPKRPCHVSSC